jgi:hypothetical protein
MTHPQHFGDAGDGDEAFVFHQAQNGGAARGEFIEDGVLGGHGRASLQELCLAPGSAEFHNHLVGNCARLLQASFSGNERRRSHAQLSIASSGVHAFLVRVRHPVL